MRSQLAGLRVLVIPWGAGPGDPRIVIGGTIPPLLLAYIESLIPGADAILNARILYATQDEYFFEVLVKDDASNFAYLRGIFDESINYGWFDVQTIFNTAGLMGVIIGDPDAFFIQMDTVGSVDINADNDIRLNAATPSGPGDVVLTGDAIQINGPISWGSNSADPSISEFDQDPAEYSNFAPGAGVFAATSATDSPTVTFRMPPSGRCMFHMSAATDADANNEAYEADVQIRLTNAAGAVQHAPTTADGQGINYVYPTALAAFTNQCGWRYFTGTPNTVYWARLMIASATIDIRDQNLLVQPLL
jgi:hypothetical protein